MRLDGKQPGRGSHHAPVPDRAPETRRGWGARRAFGLTRLMALLLLFGNRAAAKGSSADPAADAATDPAGERAAVQLIDLVEVEPEFEFSLEFASAYVFRGYNVFQEQSQREQKMVQRPRFVWTPPHTGLSLGYAGANQMTGANLADNVAAGVGAEQDLFAIYNFGRQSPLGLAAELTLVAYPAAAKEAAGTTVPLFASAATELRYLRSSFLYLGYLHGVRRGPFAEDYFYVNPRIDTRLDLGHQLELELELGAGIKVFPDAPGAVRDNMVDVLAGATLYYAISDVFYIGAKVAWAWTNLQPFQDAETGRRMTPGLANEYVPFWSLIIGTEITRGDESASPVPSRHRLHAL